MIGIALLIRRDWDNDRVSISAAFVDVDEVACGKLNISAKIWECLIKWYRGKSRPWGLNIFRHGSGKLTEEQYDTPGGTAVQLLLIKEKGEGESAMPGALGKKGVRDKKDGLPRESLRLIVCPMPILAQPLGKTCRGRSCRYFFC